MLVILIDGRRGWERVEHEHALARPAPPPAAGGSSQSDRNAIRSRSCVRVKTCAKSSVRLGGDWR